MICKKTVSMDDEFFVHHSSFRIHHFFPTPNSLLPSSPQFKIHQRPKLLLVVSHAVDMLADEPLHLDAIEVVVSASAGREQQVRYERLERSAKPGADGNGESHLAPVEELCRQPRTERLLQQHLGAKPADEQRVRYTGRQFHQLVVEKGYALFDRCRHGHLVSP